MVEVSGGVHVCSQVMCDMVGRKVVAGNACHLGEVLLPSRGSGGIYMSCLAGMGASCRRGVLLSSL